MKKGIKIYLCGSIKKGNNDNMKKYYWGVEEEKEITKYFGIDWKVELLNPSTFGIKRQDSFSNFGGDMYLVKESDFIFVDARDKRGIGIGGEMFAAKYFSIPVVSLCPKNSHYRKEYIDGLCGESITNWIHPFISSLSDYLADSIYDGVKWMIDFTKKPKKVKGIEIVREAISYFTENQSIERF